MLDANGFEDDITPTEVSGVFPDGSSYWLATFRTPILAKEYGENVSTIQGVIVAYNPPIS